MIRKKSKKIQNWKKKLEHMLWKGFVSGNLPSYMKEFQNS